MEAYGKIHATISLVAGSAIALLFAGVGLYILFKKPELKYSTGSPPEEKVMSKSHEYMLAVVAMVLGAIVFGASYFIFHMTRKSKGFATTYGTISAIGDIASILDH